MFRKEHTIRRKNIRSNNFADKYRNKQQAHNNLAFLSRYLWVWLREFLLDLDCDQTNRTKFKRNQVHVQLIMLLQEVL